MKRSGRSTGQNKLRSDGHRLPLLGRLYRRVSTMNKILSVAIGGALGSVFRYEVQRLSQSRLGIIFPYGTLIVNVSGAFLIGVLMTIFLDHVEVVPQWRLFLVVGILGGYTTFSSLTWEAYRLFATGNLYQGCLYVGGSFFGGMVALLAGVFLGRLI